MITDKPISVLIVEDNPGDLTIIRRMLASALRAHFEIIHASNLSSALRQLRYGADVVLLDLNLPDSHDLETLRRLRDCAPSVPIIVVTGLEEAKKVAAALSNGAQGFLVKEDMDADLLSHFGKRKNRGSLTDGRRILVEELRRPLSGLLARRSIPGATRSG